MTKYQELLSYLEAGEYSDYCYEFSCALSRGYPKVRFNGKKLQANRVALEYKLGRSLERGECSLHTCDNRACVNPKHLFAGTNSDNVNDRQAKGRGTSGADHAPSKLSHKQVNDIKQMISNGVPLKSIQSEFPVSLSHLYSIKNGRYWT